MGIGKVGVLWMEGYRVLIVLWGGDGIFGTGETTSMDG